ncbi:TraR/DksA C4-type zinc finger protein [Sphingopyxis indica]|uniref:TraR/DksA family transcriptional regulator n=1 Tax=Sphingopyxis indica TaxID=436663 RepID=UPI002938D79C|nr:TraR/DksA C4-type zinc finger protein [Sphingopyxis indica]WOF44758.1 TraR/DksA C4-type zinc finger protein [Sphingopyxis indica]
MPLSPDTARVLLKAQLQALDEEDALGREGTAPVTLEQDSVGRLSRIDAMQMQAMALAQQRRRASQRRQVEAALQRIETGEFGYCINCGEEIAEARLRNNPAIATCVTCAGGG